MNRVRQEAESQHAQTDAEWRWKLDMVEKKLTAANEELERERACALQDLNQIEKSLKQRLAHVEQDRDAVAAELERQRTVCAENDAKLAKIEQDLKAAVAELEQQRNVAADARNENKRF